MGYAIESDKQEFRSFLILINASSSPISRYSPYCFLISWSHKQFNFHLANWKIVFDVGTCFAKSFLTISTAKYKAWSDTESPDVESPEVQKERRPRQACLCSPSKPVSEPGLACFSFCQNSSFNYYMVIHDPLK